MAPRKVSDAPATEPRRSGRLASQPVLENPVQKPKAPKATKKRSAEALGEAKDEEASAAKKAKADSDVADVASEEAQVAAAPQAAKEEASVATEAEGAKDAVVSNQLEIGDSLPELTLQNEKGEDVKVAELAAEKGVILFLVPKADTPGCTTQACGFRDSYPDFTSLNYNVYCLSADSPAAQSKWQTKKELPYPLLSDPKRLLITALGAGKDGKTKRSHFIFAKGGKLAEKKLPVSPGDSPKLALAFIKAQSE